MSEIKPDPEWWMPRAWPTWARRAFVLTLPISGPLWCASVMVAGVSLLVVAIVIGLPAAAIFWIKEELWDEQPSR